MKQYCQFVPLQGMYQHSSLLIDCEWQKEEGFGTESLAVLLCFKGTELVLASCVLHAYGTVGF